MSSLYLDHFGLQKPPFKITPDPDFFFTGGRRGDVLSALEHVAGTEEGIIVVVAEVGSGKTLLARLLLERLGSEICTVYLSNPVFSRDEILTAIARDLGIANAGNNTESKLSVLQSELLRRHAAGQRVLLVVDEAHAMPPESLEEIRLLSNLETAHHKLLNILLFGQPELDALLARNELRQVRDRVIHRFELLALPHDEACAYVDHRLRAAGWTGGALFASSALAELVKSSAGRARRINLLADKALLSGYAKGREQVAIDDVRAAVSELGLDSGQGRTLTHAAAWWHRPQFWMVCAAMAMIAFGAGWWGSQWKRSDSAMLQAAQPAAISGVTASGSSALGGTLSTSSGVSSETPKPVPTQPLIAAAKAAPGMPGGQKSVAVAPASEKTQALIVSPQVGKSGEIRGLSAASSQSLLPYLKQLQQVLQADPLEGYSIQLASLPRDENVTRYVKNAAYLVDAAMIFVQPSVYNGREYISVFYGKFDDMAAAQRAIVGLPVALKSNKPVVRTWTKIKEDHLP